MEYILTLDVGTTSVKACLFDQSLSLAAQTSREYTLQTAGKCVEVSAHVYLDAAEQCVRALPEQARRRVCAAAVTTQGETLLCVDRQGRALRPAIVWLDSRADEQAAQLGRTLDRQHFYEHTGLPELSGALPLAKLLWLRENEPEIWKQTERFLLLEDYFLLWLTGRAVTEKSLLTSTGYFDLQTDDYWNEALALAGLSRAQLPQAMECGHIVGTILPECAQRLGLPETVQIVTGAMDQTAAALAAGCTQPGCVCETTGTAMVAAAYTECPQFSDAHHVTVYRHAMQGAYLYLPISNTAGMSLRWFRDVFCAETGDDYAALDRMAAQAPPGSRGVTFLPFLAGCVDPMYLPEATGCFCGLRLSTTKDCCIRAILEAVAFQLRDFLEMLHALGCEAGAVTSLGGGAGSELWMQIKADVCDRPFRTLSTIQATSLGAAVLAAGALGWKPVKAAVKRTYQPQNHIDYNKPYTAYRSACAALYGKKG